MIVDTYGINMERQEPEIYLKKYVSNYFRKKLENAYAVQSSPGDGGIDALVGDLDGDIIKYFIDGIGDAKKAQIKV